jgi:hypothetical protein
MKNKGVGMIKRIVTVVLTVMMGVSVVAVAGCEEKRLMEYKEDARQNLQAYAEDMDQVNFKQDQWAQIQQAVEDCKAAIDAANTKSQVDDALAAVKSEVEEIKRIAIGTNGEFYTLQEAYDHGLLTVEDLQSIADNRYHHIGRLPIETLSETLQATIKETGARGLRSFGPPEAVEAKASDIKIDTYCGTYNNVVAVVIYDAFTGDYTTDIISEIVEGVTFIYSGPRTIIWKA